MVSNVDFALPFSEFIPEGCDFYDDFNGECEECGDSVPERFLGQCEFGFCGKFICTECGFRCLNCEGNLVPSGYCLCTHHAGILRPICCRCKERYCSFCTQVTMKKCETCSRTLCSQCEHEERDFQDCRINAVNVTTKRSKHCKISAVQPSDRT